MVGAYGQGVTEIPLNLSRAQRQALFAALEVNLLPENRFYRYDFILDNCSTRPRDSIEHVTGSPIVLRDAGRRTFREMLDPYFNRIPWAGLGVSLLMGAGVDRLASPREACFLPADLERAVQTGRNGEQALAGEKKEIFAPEPLAQTSPFLTPIVVFWSGGIIWSLFWLLRQRGHATWPTALLLMVFGLLGIFVFVLSCWSRLWVLKANYNLWWLFPLHFPAGLFPRCLPGARRARRGGRSWRGREAAGVARQDRRAPHRRTKRAHLQADGRRHACRVPKCSLGAARRYRNPRFP